MLPHKEYETNLVGAPRETKRQPPALNFLDYQPIKVQLR